MVQGFLCIRGDFREFFHQIESLIIVLCPLLRSDNFRFTVPCEIVVSQVLYVVDVLTFEIRVL
jgi:hypothetical protein